MLMMRRAVATATSVPGHDRMRAHNHLRLAARTEVVPNSRYWLATCCVLLHYALHYAGRCWPDMVSNTGRSNGRGLRLRALPEAPAGRGDGAGVQVCQPWAVPVHGHCRVRPVADFEASRRVSRIRLRRVAVSEEAGAWLATLGVCAQGEGVSGPRWGRLRVSLPAFSPAAGGLPPSLRRADRSPHPVTARPIPSFSFGHSRPRRHRPHEGQRLADRAPEARGAPPQGDGADPSPRRRAVQARRHPRPCQGWRSHIAGLRHPAGHCQVAGCLLPEV